jgi:hypothetical protein
MSEPNESQTPNHVQAEVKYVDNPAQPFAYVNQLLIRRLPDAVAISFAITHGPFELKPDVERIKREGIPANIVSKIVVSNDRFPSFMRALNQILEQMESGEPSDEYDESETGRESSSE